MRTTLFLALGAAKLDPVEPESFERVVAEGIAFQAKLDWLEPVAVGGTAAALHCQHRFSNLTYDPVGVQSCVTRFAEVCEQEPLDFHAVQLTDYKGLKPPFTDWAFVRMTCQNLARQLLKLELAADLPLTLDAGFVAPGKRP